MKRVDLMLAAVLMVCALATVQAQHRARSLFIETESLVREARELEVEWGKLQLEQSSLAESKRVEELAKTQLGLVTPAIDKIWLLEAGQE
jgi:cell division protein FtsL